MHLCFHDVFQESEYMEKMSSQKYKYDSTIKDLETEITALTEQLIKSHQLNTEHDELMQQTAILQNSMKDLEDQNDLMRKTIETYQQKYGELQITIDKAQFEVSHEFDFWKLFTNLVKQILEWNNNNRAKPTQIRHCRQEQENIWADNWPSESPCWARHAEEVLQVLTVFVANKTSNIDSCANQRSQNEANEYVSWEF